VRGRLRLTIGIIFPCTGAKKQFGLAVLDAAVAQGTRSIAGEPKRSVNDAAIVIAEESASRGILDEGCRRMAIREGHPVQSRHDRKVRHVRSGYCRRSPEADLPHSGPRLPEGRGTSAAGRDGSCGGPVLSPIVRAQSCGIC